jgi:hypothetical protein
MGDNVIIPIPSVDRGPADERNIKGVVMNVNEHGGYKIGTKVGQIKGYMSRNQVQVFELVISETLSWLNFVQIITCTGQYCTSHNLYFCVVQVIICTLLLYKL